VHFLTLLRYGVNSLKPKSVDKKLPLYWSAGGNRWSSSGIFPAVLPFRPAMELTNYRDNDIKQFVQEKPNPGLYG
ncbi:MAG: hypothetical protein PVJ84_17805, partial [Desulfobacteraceae bacterium]